MTTDRDAAKRKRRLARRKKEARERREVVFLMRAETAADFAFYAQRIPVTVAVARSARHAAEAWLDLAARLESRPMLPTQTTAPSMSETPAEHEHDDADATEYDPKELEEAFLGRADASTRLALTTRAHRFPPVTADVVHYARKAASAWSELADSLQGHVVSAEPERFISGAD